MSPRPPSGAPHVLVIGAGFGGLAAALRARAAGWAVTVVEAAATPGGKARSLPSVAGPVDTGPTVLTLRREFDALFALFGRRLDDHIRLIPQPVLARHFWPDGSRLDLHADADATAEAIAAFAGGREADAFRRYDALTRALYAAFEGPVMRSARPDLPAIARAALRQPRLWPALIPGRSLQALLRARFRDPRLIQMFARYATYVGGRPSRSPAILSLVWQAEAQGVWAVAGGMSGLAAALAALGAEHGVAFRYGTCARSIGSAQGRAIVDLDTGERISPDAVIYNGDPGALTRGVMGDAARAALPARASHPPSLSAQVWAFAATPQGPRANDLIHHNVFFAADPAEEFGPLLAGQVPREPTLYVCAEDRAESPPAPGGAERFEIILNAPPLAGAPPDLADPEEAAECAKRTFPKLASMGLSFLPPPDGTQSLTVPRRLDMLFPGSLGAIYGLSPEGTLASFQRPTARTRLAGLYLAGGGAHPGAGVPMATLSGMFAVEAMLRDRTSALTSRPTDTPGGILTGSKTAAETGGGKAAGAARSR